MSPFEEDYLSGELLPSNYGSISYTLLPGWLSTLTVIKLKTKFSFWLAHNPSSRHRDYIYDLLPDDEY